MHSNRLAKVPINQALHLKIETNSSPVQCHIWQGHGVMPPPPSWGDTKFFSHANEVVICYKSMAIDLNDCVYIERRYYKSQTSKQLQCENFCQQFTHNITNQHCLALNNQSFSSLKPLRAGLFCIWLKLTARLTTEL